MSAAPLPPGPAARTLLAFILSLLALKPAHAVDVPNRNPPAEERAVRDARAAIARKDWAVAVSHLIPHVQTQPDSADAYNLLGYAFRHLERYAESEMAYERALALDPDHLGAHEYQGELMLILGRRERAHHHLRELARLCPSGCDEYDDLRRAIDAYPVSPATR
jgi:tetratricopeptide (TPR) repeat protein